MPYSLISNEPNILVKLDKLLNELKDRLYENKIHIEFSEQLKEYIIDSSFSYDFGARPIKRFISKNIETLIASKIIKEEIKPNNKVTIDYQNNEIVVK